MHAAATAVAVAAAAAARSRREFILLLLSCSIDVAVDDDGDGDRHGMRCIRLTLYPIENRFSVFLSCFDSLRDSLQRRDNDIIIAILYAHIRQYTLYRLRVVVVFCGVISFGWLRLADAVAMAAIVFLAVSRSLFLFGSVSRRACVWAFFFSSFCSGGIL